MRFLITALVLTFMTLVLRNISETTKLFLVIRDEGVYNVESQDSNLINMSKPTSHLFGFFYQVYKQPKATLEVIKSVLRHMPDSPIYMVSSGGYHYDPLAHRFPQNIRYVYETHNFNPPQATGSLRLWFDRVQEAAKWCNCSFLILLEDDVRVQGPLTQRPPHDAGGLPAHIWTGTWYDRLLPQMNISHWSYSSHGMCGGSYLKVRSFLKAYATMNWERINTLHVAWDPIGRFNDVTLAVMLMDQGYQLQPWDQLSQIRTLSFNSSAAIVHNYKVFYNQPLSEYDGSVVVEENETYKDPRVLVK